MTPAAVSEQLLKYVVLGELAVAVPAVAWIALHGIWLWRRDLADAPRLARGRAALAAAVDGPANVDDQHLAELRRLPARVRRHVVEQLAMSVTGEDGRKVAAVAASLGLVDAARRRCRSRWWWRRLLGAHQLNLYGAGDADLPRLFDDPHPAVRAQVIEWAGDAGRADLAPRLLAALEDDSPLCRYSAADSILRSGAPVVDALVGELAQRSGRELGHIMEVLAHRPDPRYSRAALDATANDLGAVRAAAAALLGGIGGAEAGTALGSLLRDTEPAVRAAAADGLRRLGHQEAAPSLAPLLRDPSFEVRRAAGAALAGLGAGGILLLRHYAGDLDPRTSDMARYSLDMAGLRGAGSSPPH
ncbi:MAG: HEAT repeat domain-containing protein [Acidimicrobiales bacterium]